MASGIKVKANFKKQAVKNALRNSMVTTLPRAGAFVRQIARNSLKKRGTSTPGKPPISNTGRFKRSILFEVSQQKDSVIIGPDSKLFSNVGKAHEFGGRFRKERFKKRPTMGPALIKATPKLPKLWAKTVRS